MGSVKPRGRLTWLRRLTLQDWSWVHFKLAVIAWAATLLRYPPDVVAQTLGGLVMVVPIVTIAGAVVSLVGLFMSAQTGTCRVVGIVVELSGLIVLLAGPIGYLIVQAGLAVSLPDGDQRKALAVLAYVFFAASVGRILLVVPMFWHEAHDESKAV